MATVLVVEDDEQLAHTIGAALAADGHAIVHASTAHQALGLAATEHPRAVVLDLGLPDLPGLDVLMRLRKERHPASVLILTAANALEDRVTGLRLGADDYLGKPFALTELRARVAALVRRGHREQQEELTVGRYAWIPMRDAPGTATTNCRSPHASSRYSPR